MSCLSNFGSMQSGVLCKIHNVDTQTVLTSRAATGGNYLYAWKDSDSDEQKWYITMVDDGYLIKSVYSGRYAALRSDSLHHGAEVVQPFKWQFVINDNTTIKILAFNTQLGLGTLNNVKKVGDSTTVQGHSGDHQLWKIERLPETSIGTSSNN
ncbi:hypothetical protein AMATHDRAFT_49820 [Amanita thiersii Skay4041]|uniref:Ricin B lectin domain-containing protein n=1 Tax=Amanita thiersii Skay4041 TaxID=703135 RepID=A0A2A9NK41_9AGAR|nr:hypothetical protein AMATHDRAFT_49820 [Amanita thiersii Skay4041]